MPNHLHDHQTVFTTTADHERDGRFNTTAYLAEDSRDVGVGDTPQEAVWAALRSLGEPYAGAMAAGVGDEAD